MYRVAVQREIVMQHYLTGADFGPENQLHSHVYRVELRLAGEELDSHGFLADIDAMKAALDAVLADLRGKPLNDLPAFQGLNPSVEHLARILCRALRLRLPTGHLREVAVTIWEDADAWAAYTEMV